jgi:CubicO group peptidase (beta-lactamase class C family)
VPSNVDHLPPFQWPGYSPRQLDESFRGTELRHPAGEGFGYSSLGMGLLGHILAVAGKDSYENLIHEELLAPLGMTDTAISLQQSQQKRYSTGYDENDSSAEVPYYEYGILAGCGAHRSTVLDLARFLGAQWGATDDTNPLTERVRSQLHRIRWRSQDDETLMALGWFAVPYEGVGTLLVHRGRTPGHGAVVGFIPEKRAGVVVLANRGGRDANVGMADFAERLLLRLVATSP